MAAFFLNGFIYPAQQRYADHDGGEGEHAAIAGQQYKIFNRGLPGRAQICVYQLVQGGTPLW